MRQRQATLVTTARRLGRYLVALGLIGLAQPLAAQESAAVDDAAPPLRLCSIVTDPEGSENGAHVRAQCWGHGLDLGRAKQVHSSLNLRLSVTLVELERDGLTQVLLLRAGPDGQPLVEDISASIAVAARRAPWTQLDGLELDIADFARNGRIGARHPATVASGSRTLSRPQAPVDEGVVDIGQHLMARPAINPADIVESDK